MENKEFINGKANVDAEYIEMILINFNDALKENNPEVYLGFETLSDGEIKRYNIVRKNWISSLEMFLKTAINLELYEQCAAINLIIERIKLRKLDKL